MPYSLDATTYLQENGVLFIAWIKLLTRGGVATSALEDEPELHETFLDSRGS